MQSDASSNLQTPWYPDPKLVGAIMTAFALLTPFMIFMSFGYQGIFEYTIDAPIWRYISWSIPPIMFGFFGSIFFITRFWFVFEMYRGYQNNGSRKRLIVVGFLSEMPLSVLLLMTIIMNALTPYVGFPRVMIPLPTLFIAGLIFIILTPPPKLTLFKTEEKQQERFLT